MTEFDTVAPALRQALTDRGYTTLTPVQRAMLEPERKNADLLVSARTGSGKTVAFGLAVAATLLEGRERFEPAEAPLALVVAPTRELALQVQRELDWLFAGTGARIASCVGGMDIRNERRALGRGAHIVVGTPGRLVDHLERGSLDASALETVVLDEADEMLDLGFRDELETILAAAPDMRRTLMFSATVSKGIAHLAQRYQSDAIRVSVTSEAQHSDIAYQALTAAPHDQERAIVNLLRFHEAKNAIVFCGTRAAVADMTARLHERGFAVVALSGELSQKERSHALQALRDGRARVCVATDVAARGIDLPDLELVIHSDLPKKTETLLHRSGRTGRAGRKGVSALVLPPKARRRVERLLREARIEAEWTAPPSAEAVRARDEERLLTDPVLAEAPREAETALIERLLAEHGAERIAAAFLRLQRLGRSEPEELSPTEPPRERRERAPREPGERPAERTARARVENGAWIALSVGREQSADPRWLLPLICNAGGVTKSEVGAIRIHRRETHVEIEAARLEAFLQHVGPSGTLDKSIRITRLDARPAPPRETPAEPAAQRTAAPKAEEARTDRANPASRRGSKRERRSTSGGYAPLKRKTTAQGAPSATDGGRADAAG